MDTHKSNLMFFLISYVGEGADVDIRLEKDTAGAGTVSAN